MRALNLKSELIQQKATLDATLKEKLTNRALQSENEITLGQLLSKAEVIRQTDKIMAK